MKSNGLVALKDYPYTKRMTSCKSQAPKMKQKIRSTFSGHPNGNEGELKKVLANVGPVVVYMYAKDSFQHYKSGVYYDQSCPSRCPEINHAVLLVGYGTDKTTYKKPVDYWIIKNSWGTTWGEAGYGRMIKGKGNSCNIACFIRYSVV